MYQVIGVAIADSRTPVKKSSVYHIGTITTFVQKLRQKEHENTLLKKVLAMIRSVKPTVSMNNRIKHDNKAELATVSIYHFYFK